MTDLSSYASSEFRSCVLEGQDTSERCSEESSRIDYSKYAYSKQKSSSKGAGRTSWTRKDKENRESGNQVQYLSQQTSGSELENDQCLVMGQNHEANKAWGNSASIIGRLRDDRRRLVENGDIRHRAFRDAHRRLLDKSDVKKREFINKSNDELRSMLLEKIAKNVKQSDTSASVGHADLHHQSKSSINIANVLADIDQNAVDCMSMSAASKDGRLNPQSRLQADGKISQEDIEIGAMFETAKGNGRDLKFEEICYTKSKGNITDRDQVFCSIGDQNVWQGAMVERCIDYEEAEACDYEAEDSNNGVIFHEDDECFESSAIHGPSRENVSGLKLLETNQYSPTPVDDINVPMISLSERDDIAESDIEKMEKSLNTNIADHSKAVDFTSKVELTECQKTNNHIDIKPLSITTYQEVPRSKASLLMESLALKMEAMQKRAEHLRNQVVEDEPTVSMEVEPQILGQVSIEAFTMHKSESRCFICLSSNNESQRAENDDEGTNFERINTLVNHKRSSNASSVTSEERLNVSDLQETENIPKYVVQCPTVDHTRRTLAVNRSSSMTIATIAEVVDDASMSIDRYECCVDVQCECVELIDCCPVMRAEVERRKGVAIEPAVWEGMEEVWVIEIVGVVAVEPVFEIVEFASMFQQDLSMCFYKTMKSSQLNFDQQAEIFGHEEGPEESSFQGFLAAANRSEGNLKERTSAGIERGMGSHTRKVVKGGPTNDKSGKSSRRYSGSRYALNVSRGHSKVVQTTYMEDDSLNLVKRTLHREFEQLQSTAEKPKNEPAICFNLADNNTIGNKESCSPLLPVKRLHNSIILEVDTEEITQSKFYRSNEAADQKLTPKSSASKFIDRAPRTVSKEKSKQGSASKDRSDSRLRSSLKKNIYKMLASSTREAEVADILFIKDKLEEDNETPRLFCEGAVEDRQADCGIEGINIVDKIKDAIDKRFEPMVSEQYSSYMEETRSFRKNEFTGRKTDCKQQGEGVGVNQIVQDTPSRIKELTIRVHPAESPKREIKDINEEIDDIQKVIEQVGIISLGIFQQVDEEAITEDEKFHSSTACKNLKFREPFIQESFYNSHSKISPRVSNHNERIEFSAYERWYAREKCINLANIRSKSEFRDKCIKSSCKDRGERARLLLEMQDSPQKRAKDDSPFNLEDLNDSQTDMQRRYTKEMPQELMKINNEAETAEQLDKNLFFKLLTIQLNIENESLRIVGLLDSCPGFQVNTFLSTLFEKFGRAVPQTGIHTLHRNAFFKIIKGLGSKCPAKVFDSYWGYKFGKLNISKVNFAKELFRMDPSDFNSAECSETVEEDFSLYSPTAKNLLVLLFDLSIKGEIHFHQEKTKVGVSQIMEFCRLIAAHPTEDLQIEDLLRIPFFSGFSIKTVQGIGRRLERTAQSRTLSAYNICILLS